MHSSPCPEKQGVCARVADLERDEECGRIKGEDISIHQQTKELKPEMRILIIEGDFEEFPA